MPEIINNVTSGSALLHEVFQETVKQTFQSAGFQVYEYDQNTGRFKSVVDGSDLGFDVRFPRINWLYDYQGIGENVFIHGNVVVDWLEGENLVPIFYNERNTKYRTFSLLRLSSGNVSSILSTEQDFYYDSDTQHEILIMNPKPGYLIFYALGVTKNPKTNYYQDFVFTISYNLSDNSLSEKSKIRASIEDDTSWDVFGLGNQSDGGNKLGHFISKVYKQEDENYVRYTVFTFYHRNGGEIYANTITFDKNNNSTSYKRKLVHQGLYSTFKDHFYPPGGDSVWYWSHYTSVKTDDYHAGVQLYLKEALSVVDSNVINGNLVFAFRGLPPNSFDVVIELIPFTATLNYDVYDNTSFSLDLNSRVVYAPFNIRRIFSNAYVSPDQNVIEIPRSSSYTPPPDYQKIVEGVDIITAITNFLVITSDIDQGGRLKVSSILSSGLNSEIERERSAGLYGNPSTYFINYELTEGGSYFTGFSSMEPWVIKGPFLISKYHNKVFTMARVLPEKQEKRNDSFDLYLITLDNPLPQGVVWGSELDKRVTQPYIAKLSLSGLSTYRPNTSNTNTYKTEFLRKNEIYLTNFVQVDFHDSGYFTPFFVITNGGGDGEWLDSQTLYIGLDTYHPSQPSNTWRKIFAVNGVVNVVKTSYDYYDYPSQVNSTISLVTKLVVSPQRGVFSLIGIQGSNRLKFLNISVVDDTNLFTYPQVFLPFGNVSIWNNSVNGALIPHAQIYYYQQQNDVWYAYFRNKQYKWYNLERRSASPRRPVVVYNYNKGKTDYSILFYGSRVKTPPSVDLASTVVFVNKGFDGLFGFTPKIVLTPKESLSLVRVFDTSETLTEGDYIILEDTSDPKNPVSMKYVVINTSSYDIYKYSYNNETSKVRMLECALVEIQYSSSSIAVG